MAKAKCARCRAPAAGAVYSPRWHVGGDRIGHMEWGRDTTPLPLCRACYSNIDDDFRFCDGCGDRVSTDGPYLTDAKENPVCPVCHAARVVLGLAEVDE